jgi:predicted transcriptional regulator
MRNNRQIRPTHLPLNARQRTRTELKLSQTEAAKKLGTTQAAVSQYLSSKRAYKGYEHVKPYLPKIQAMASETARKLANKEIEADEVTPDFCSLCITFCKKEHEVPESKKPEYYI